MTFPSDLIIIAMKDTTADELLSPRFYANGSDFNGIFANLLGIESQLGVSFKLDITSSGNQIFFAGPAQVVIGGMIVEVVAGSVSFAGAGVTFAWVDQAGLITSGAALPTTDNYLPIAQVTTGGGGIVTSWIDLRPWLTGTGGGGGGTFPSSYRATTSQRRYSRRDVVVLANTDFMPAAFKPLGNSSWFYIDVVSDTTAVLTLFQIHTATNSMVLGTMTAGVEKQFIVQAPLLYDSSATEIQYQLQSSLGATLDFITITEVEFDALVSTGAAGSGMELLPFSVQFVFSSGSPVLLFTLLAGDVIESVELVIETPFDDIAATLSVGTMAVGVDGILDENDIDPRAAAGQFATFANYTSTIVDVLLLTIASGGSTAGSGYVSGVIRRA